MVDKKVEFDVVAKDKASDKVDDVGDALDRAGKKAEAADGKFRGFASRVSEVGRTVAGATGKVAAFASLVGPLVSGVVGVGKALAVAGQGVAGLAPLIAFAPSMIGGWKFLKWTIAGIGKQMGEELKPLGKDFQQLQVDAGKLASDGVAKVGEEFKRANFPAIREAMTDIGRSINDQIKFFGKWVNGAQGVKFVGDTVLGVDDAFNRAAPSITRVAIALGELANRANVRFQLQMLGDDVARLADRFAGWLDSVSARDVTQALSDVGDAFAKVRDTFVFLRDVGRWMGENEGKVRAFSDALAVLGIALGAFTGNPLAVVVGGLTLLINHWDTVKSRLSGASGWWSATWSAIANDPSVQSIWQSLKDIATTVKGDLQAAWNQLRPALAQIAAAAADLWQKLGPMVAQFFRDPNVVAGIRAIATAVAAVAVAFVAFSVAAAAAVAAVSAGLTGFVAWFTGTFVRGVLGGLATLIGAFGAWLVSMGKTVQAIPGLQSVGQAMVRAGQDAQTAAGQIRGMADSIGKLQSKTITITTIYKNHVVTVGNANMREDRADGGRVGGYAAGGRIPGQPSRFDTIPVMAARGEFIVNARSTAQNLRLLEAINSGRPFSIPAPPPAAAGAPVINVTVQAGAVGSEDFLARTVSEQVEASLRQGRGSLILAGRRD
jgi:hypothetical protein